MYTDVLDDIYGVFASSNWTAQNISIYPDNYQGKISNSNEFCRLNILPSSSERYKYTGNKLLSGLIAIKIFVKAGEGQKRIYQISEILDSLLENKKFSHGTELGTSYISMEGLDAINQSLYSASYFITFRLYGE